MRIPVLAPKMRRKKKLRNTNLLNLHQSITVSGFSKLEDYKKTLEINVIGEILLNR